MVQFPQSSNPFEGEAMNCMMAWLDSHMAVDCVDCAIDSNLAQKPLLFESQALIEGRIYTLVLKKMPDFYWLQEFIVTANDKPPTSAGPPIVTHNFVDCNTVGFYSVITEKSEDNDYLIRMHITRY